MLERGLSNTTGIWLELLQRQWRWGIILFFCANAMTGCGIPSTPTPTQTLPQTPQETTEAGPFHATVQTVDGAFTLTLDVTPNRSGGPNVFTLTVMDNHTAKPAPAVDVTLYTTHQDMAMGTDSIALHDDGNGQFSATSNSLIMGGHWAIGISVLTPDHLVHKAGVKLVTA